MGLRFITGYELGTENLPTYDYKKAMLFCSTSGIVFGEVFSATEDQALTALEVASGFLQWAQDTQNITGGDVRSLELSEISRLRVQYHALSTADKAGWYKRFQRNRQ